MWAQALSAGLREVQAAGAAAGAPVAPHSHSKPPRKPATQSSDERSRIRAEVAAGIRPKADLFRVA